jgi:transcriptional regulator of acetoin/glycerol metabolism
MVEGRDLPPEIFQPAGGLVSTQVGVSSVPVGGALPVIPEPTWEEHEKAKILEALQRTNWNITRAAQLLGMTFRTLQYRLEKFGMKKP